MKSQEQLENEVKEYYGTTLQTTNDLKTNACSTGAASYPSHIKKIMSKIHDEVHSKYYGCGLVIPSALHGCVALDLGCGAGRDCYILSALVGEKGTVIGVDFSEEQLAVARRHEEYHQKQFGFERNNLHFLMGNINELNKVDVGNSEVDVVVSNCVVNLARNKREVLSGLFTKLKDGGEFYFSDVYADRRVPQSLVDDPVLYGECLTGAMYWADFEHLARSVGFLDPRVVESSLITVQNAAVSKKVGPIKFYSVTYRLLKIGGLDEGSEDYGQAVTYKGTMEECAHEFVLDRHHEFITGKVQPVCGNTWRMLHGSRFKAHFDFTGDFSRHFGMFEGCGQKASSPFSDGCASSSCC